MDVRKTLFIGTLATALSIFGIGALWQTVQRHTLISWRTDGFPSMGKTAAPIEVVLIEDFQCKNCRAFTHKILPKIHKKYIKTGNVRFTLIPVSFLAGSQMIANALLEVYHQSPSQFFSYLHEVLMQEEDLKMADLVRFARRLKGIDLERFQTCVQRGCHSKELQKNLSWAQSKMGSHFRTPAIYINGSMGSTYSFEAIQYQIEEILKR